MKFFLFVLINLIIACHQSSFAYATDDFRVKVFFEIHGKKLVKLSSENLVFDSLNNSNSDYSKVFWFKANEDLALFAFTDTLSGDKKYFIENKSETCFYQSIFFLDRNIPSITNYSDLIRFSEAWIRFNYAEKSMTNISRFDLGPGSQNIVVKKRLVLREGKDFFLSEKVVINRFSYFYSDHEFCKLKKTKLKIVLSNENLNAINKDDMRPLAFRLGYQILFW